MLTLTILLIVSAGAAKADSVRFCFLFCEIETSSPADSFCKAYQPVIRSQADAASAKQAKGNVLRRTAANDTLYRCTCQGWKDPICKR